MSKSNPVKFLFIFLVVTAILVVVSWYAYGKYVQKQVIVQSIQNLNKNKEVSIEFASIDSKLMQSKSPFKYNYRFEDFKITINPSQEIDDIHGSTVKIYSPGYEVVADLDVETNLLGTQAKIKFDKEIKIKIFDKDSTTNLLAKFKKMESNIEAKKPISEIKLENIKEIKQISYFEDDLQIINLENNESIYESDSSKFTFKVNKENDDGIIGFYSKGVDVKFLEGLHDIADTYYKNFFNNTKFSAHPSSKEISTTNNYEIDATYIGPIDEPSGNSLQGDINFKLDKFKWSNEYYSFDSKVDLIMSFKDDDVQNLSLKFNDNTKFEKQYYDLIASTFKELLSSSKKNTNIISLSIGSFLKEDQVEMVVPKIHKLGSIKTGIDIEYKKLPGKDFNIQINDLSYITDKYGFNIKSNSSKKGGKIVSNSKLELLNYKKIMFDLYRYARNITYVLSENSINAKTAFMTLNNKENLNKIFEFLEYIADKPISEGQKNITITSKVDQSKNQYQFGRRNINELSAYFFDLMSQLQENKPGQIPPTGN